MDCCNFPGFLMDDGDTLEESAVTDLQGIERVDGVGKFLGCEVGEWQVGAKMYSCGDTKFRNSVSDEGLEVRS